MCVCLSLYKQMPATCAGYMPAVRTTRHILIAQSLHHRDAGMSNSTGSGRCRSSAGERELSDDGIKGARERDASALINSGTRACVCVCVCVCENVQHLSLLVKSMEPRASKHRSMRASCTTRPRACTRNARQKYRET